MRGLWRHLRSAAFTVVIYGAMLVMAVVLTPAAIWSRDGAIWVCRTWCRFTIWAARVIVGIELEVRGTPPTDPVMIASKHQSFFDIIAIFAHVPRGRFVMKQELKWVPIFGQYALRIGCVPVDRGGKRAAVERMLGDVQDGRAAPGQLIIYPQGTRVPPGIPAPYKQGSGALYETLDQPCVPVAVNVGLFWPRAGVAKRPGRAVVSFLDPIPPGLTQSSFLERIEREVETASDALVEEARIADPDILPPERRRD